MAAIQNDFDKSTDLYDTFSPKIKNKVKDPTTWRKIIKLTQDFMSKNDSKLATNIVGRQVLVSPKMEEEIFDIFDLDKKEISEVMNNSPCFKARFGGKKLSLDDQLCLAVPLIFAAVEYRSLKKKEESNLCYLLAHFKPYASRESFLFKYKVDEARMLYTIENLSYRFDIKNEGTIIDSLKKKAGSSYANYIDSLKPGDKLTDYRFYVCYTSGISSAVNAFLGGIFEKYMENEGKKLSFENAAKEIYDKDDDSYDYEAADIASDSALRDQVVKKTIQFLIKTPVEKSILRTACNIEGSFKPKGQASLNSCMSIMEKLINEIIDKMTGNLQEFFSALIGSFLFHTTSDGSRTYTMKDFKSPLFIAIGIDILSGKKSNVKDINLKKCRDMIEKMCTEHCLEYNLHQTTYKSQVRRCLAAYFVIVIRQANT